MRSHWLVGIVATVVAFGCASTPPSTGSGGAWPALADNFGGFTTQGHGIIVHCNVSADPRIYYYRVQRGSGNLESGAVEAFLAGILESRATRAGVSHLVVLGEFHSDKNLLFALGASEGTPESAAAEFRGVLPPGARPQRLSPESPMVLAHLTALLESLEHE